MKKFEKIGVCNDWAYETYYIGPIVTTPPFHTHSFQAQDQTRRIKNGDLLELKWPNGDVEEAIAIITERETSYGDMGHTYTTKTEDLSFRLKDKKRGTFTVPMEALEFKVRRKE